MNKYNIYRIEKTNEEALINKLLSVGLEKAQEVEIDGFVFRFYFSRQPDEVDIWWADTYSSFLQDVPKPKNKIFFGTLIVTNETLCYSISLGKSHFYLRPFCDSDFGLKMAERIADEDNLKIKNSKFYQSKKSKTITTYHDGIEIDYDSGESMHYLKAKTLDEDLWGKVASFGTSVQLNLDMPPTELAQLIRKIEQELSKAPRFKLPKVDLVRNEEKKAELDNKLVKAILASGESSDVSVEEFTVSGVNFIFSDVNSYSIYMRNYSKEKVGVDDLNIDNLLRFIRQKNINLSDALNDIYVSVKREYGRGYSQSLKKFLDFVDDEERHCLIDGKWHKFNQSYLEYLAQEVDKIDLEYQDAFDIPSTVNEDQFNNDRAKDGYINYDKDLTSLDGKYRVEKMDLYKEHTLYFVKIGSPQKLSYVIDQAQTTVKILQNRESHIEIGDTNVNIETICLWIILDGRKTDIANLSDINSIIFHMKLVEWKKVVTDAGYQPKVLLNYRR